MTVSSVSLSSEETGFDSKIGCDFPQTAFRIASSLTDPVCKCHELFRRIQVVDALNPMGDILTCLIKKIALFICLLGWAFLAIFATLPGIGLRALGSYFQTAPFIHVQEDGGKTDANSFSLFSWNVCCVGAGYPITDGGVVPWADRIDAIIHKIAEKNADVNCLYELFDANAAFLLCEKLKEHGYSHFYLNIGPQATGVSSGILIASKYKMKNPEFCPFSQDMLIGRTKYAAKGVFSFDLEGDGGLFARIYSTHLQHSEEPEFPTSDEIEARRRQMELIVEKINGVRDRCIVLTGDLNLDDREYASSLWHKQFQKGDDFVGKTWGGDGFCARLMDKRVSGPLNLDHTMILKGSARSIRTTLIETGFDPEIYQEGALSDHAGLLSEIVVGG